MFFSFRHLSSALVLLCWVGVTCASCANNDAPVVGLEQDDGDPFDAAASTPQGASQTSVGSEQPLDPNVGAGVDEACEQSGQCRYGLVCDGGTCRAIANTPATGFCFLTDECAEGLFCSQNGICRSAGLGLVGDACADASDCARGLQCSLTGMIGSCSPSGEGDIGEPCQTSAECFAGLFCDSTEACAPWSTGLEKSLWPGLDCAEVSSAAPRPYFDLSASSGEFFRLPYPSDIYTMGGGLDLSTFPRPGKGVVSFDPIAALSTAAERFQEGFSLTPTITFRFSAVMDFQSLSGSANGLLDAPTIHFVNVDPESPGYGGGPSYNWHVTDGSGNGYICPRWLAIRVGWDTQLKPDTTYAVYLTEGARDQAGTPMVADDDFVTMLAPGAPSDPLGSAAWEVFGPLRAYLADQGIPTESVIGGTVFTTQKPRDRMVELRNALFAPAAPKPLNAVLCGGDAPSPCTAEPCSAGDETFELVHMQLEMPRVQQGVRPFLSAGDGGGLAPAGEPLQLHGSDTVCASLTLPSGDIPEGGWPVLLFAHGSSGDHQSAPDNLGALMAEAGVAVLSWDGPVHGARGIGEYWPEAVVYNLANPAALSGTLYQGAADVFSVVRMLGAWSMPAAESPTGDAVVLDTAHVAFMGHGLGATIGAIAAPHEPGIGLTVWSSASAVLSEVMASRLFPKDVPQVVSWVLQEAEGSELESRHPVLALYQGLFEPVDPIAHLSLQKETGEGALVQHTLQIQGIGDWYAPSRVTDVVSRLVGAQLASPILREIEGVESVAPPVSNNVGSEVNPRTSVVIQSTPPDGPDGEPAWLAGDSWREDFGVRQQMRDFIRSWVDDGVPTLPVRTGL